MRTARLVLETTDDVLIPDRDLVNLADAGYACNDDDELQLPRRLVRDK